MKNLKKYWNNFLFALKYPPSIAFMFSVIFIALGLFVGVAILLASITPWLIPVALAGIALACIFINIKGKSNEFNLR